MSEQLDDLLVAVVLEVEGRELTGRDLMAAGAVSGRWAQLERDLSEGLGLVAAQPPPEDEVKAAVRAWRLERKLLSAEDVRAWMRPRGLTIGDVNAAARRAVARRRGGRAATVPAEELLAALPAESVCGGALRDLGWWLADRLLSTRTAAVEPIDPEDARIRGLLAAEAATAAGATSREPASERARRLAWIAALDDAHRAWEAAATSPRAISRQLRDRQLDWCRFELDELRLSSPGAAAEAAMQLAEGSDARDIAAAAGAHVTLRRLVLEDAEPGLVRTLAGAVVGSVAGPWDDGGAHVVARVRERRAPDGGDEDLLARAREALLSEAAERLRAGKIRWHDRA